MTRPLVGAATVVINPPLGSSMPGGLADRRACGVHDDLFARALVIDAGEPLALLSVDCVALHRDTVLAIRQAAEREAAIPAERVFVAATHTHHGPPSATAFQSPRDEAYLERLVGWCAEALWEAHGRARPAALGVGTVEVPGLQFNRRYWMKDGTVRTNPGIGNPEALRPAGPVNPKMRLLAFRTEGGVRSPRSASPPAPLMAGEGSEAAPPGEGPAEPHPQETAKPARLAEADGAAGKARPPAEPELALVINYALHACTIEGGEPLLSADFVGYLTQALQAALGPETVVLFLNGACGDINHWDVLGGKREATRGVGVAPPPPCARNDQATRRTGLTLAKATLNLLPNLEFRADWTVSEAHSLLTAAVREAEPVRVARAEAALAEGRAGWPRGEEEVYDYEAWHLAQAGEREVEMEIQALRLGPAALVGIPAEVFAEIGLTIEAQSPFATTAVVELAGGWEGYLPTRQAFAEGGYETRLARSSKLAEDTAEKVVAKAKEVLQAVSSGG